MEDSEATFPNAEQNDMEKHYVHKVSVVPFSGAENPYKTLVKVTFAKVQNDPTQILIKPVVY